LTRPTRSTTLGADEDLVARAALREEDATLGNVRNRATGLADAGHTVKGD
jgi:hypothetical protein